MDTITAKICNNCNWIYQQPICPKCNENNYINVIDLLIYKHIIDNNYIEDNIICPNAIK
jgi:hypothetical protein